MSRPWTAPGSGQSQHPLDLLRLPKVPYAWPPDLFYSTNPNRTSGPPGQKIHGIGNSIQSFQGHFDQGHIVPSPDELYGGKEPKTALHLLFKTIYTKDDHTPALQDYLCLLSRQAQHGLISS